MTWYSVVIQAIQERDRKFNSGMAQCKIKFLSTKYLVRNINRTLASDTTLYPQNFWEEIKQWTDVFGVSQTPTSNTTNDPEAGYSRASYGINVQAILAQGVGHTGDYILSSQLD